MRSRMIQIRWDGTTIRSRVPPISITPASAMALTSHDGDRWPWAIPHPSSVGSERWDASRVGVKGTRHTTSRLLGAVGVRIAPTLFRPARLPPGPAPGPRRHQSLATGSVRGGSAARPDSMSRFAVGPSREAPAGRRSAGRVRRVIALRSAVFGAITVGLTVLAHAAAGGWVPAPVALTVLMVVTAAVGAPLFRRGLRPAVLIPVVGAAQVALHPVFQGLSGTSAAGHAGHGS